MAGERLNETDDRRRKRLYFRCNHRGSREADLLLAGFAERHLARLSEPQLGRLEALLDAAEPELYAWITGHAPAPAAHDNDVLELLKAYVAALPKS